MTIDHTVNVTNNSRRRNNGCCLVRRKYLQTSSPLNRVQRVLERMLETCSVAWYKSCFNHLSFSFNHLEFPGK